AAICRAARPTSLSTAPYAQPSVSRMRVLAADTTSGGKVSKVTACTRAESRSSTVTGDVMLGSVCIALKRESARAAVDRDHSASNVARKRRGQENSYSGDLLGLAKAADGNFGA